MFFHDYNNRKAGIYKMPDISVLIIDDEPSILKAVSMTLKHEHIAVTCADNGTLALDILKANTFDLILLDIIMPDQDGFSILKVIRSSQNYTPVILLSGRGEDSAQVKGLELGADDYITKPFEIQEVLARIQVQLRHMQQEPEHKSVSYKNLELDRERFEVRIAGVLLPKITKQEFAILELLLEHPKQVFSKEEIFEYAWDEHYMGETKTLDVHISNIRKKIKAVTQEEYIDTVWGIGYRLHS